MDEALVKREMPHDVYAEQSVIGAMIRDSNAVTVASEILTEDDFYGKQYGVLFQAMIELYNEGQPIDLITLKNRLELKNVPSEISSIDFLKEILMTAQISVHVKQHANIVKEKAVLRKLIRVTNEISNECYSGKDKLEYILEDTEKKIFNLVQTGRVEIMFQSKML